MQVLPLLSRLFSGNLYSGMDGRIFCYTVEGKDGSNAELR